MKFQTVLAGVIAASLTGLALAQTGPAADVETPTVAEAAAQPESWRKVDPENVLVFDTTKGEPRAAIPTRCSKLVGWSPKL